MIGIFGGTGFIGRNLANQLQAASSSCLLLGRSIPAGLNDQAVRIDFSRPETYREYLEEITTAIMLVSTSVPGTNINSPANEIRDNVVPYARFLNEVANSRLRKLIFLSSGGTVYGPPENELISEEHPTRPISPYGLGKLAIEEFIKAHAIDANWKYVILRPANPVGAFQHYKKGQGLVSAAIDAALSGKKLPVWGNGEATRDYFEIEDLCKVIVSLIDDNGAENQTYNVGSGIGLSVNQVIEIVSAGIGVPVPVEYQPSRSVDLDRNVLDVAKLRAKLGFVPRAISKDTISRMLESLRHLELEG